MRPRQDGASSGKSDDCGVGLTLSGTRGPRRRGAPRIGAIRSLRFDRCNTIPPVQPLPPGSIRRIRPILAAVLAGAALVACAQGSRVAALAEADVAAAGRAAPVLMVLPLNVTVEMPEELQGPSLAVWAELENYLRDHDKQLKTVSYQDARRLWLLSVERAHRSDRHTADFATAAGLLAVELRRHAEFDAMIAPSVFIQEASMLGTRAIWDGVDRPVEIRREHRKIGRRTLHASRTARAASIHVAVFASNGRLLHQGQGGLDLLVRAQLDEDLTEDLLTSKFWYFEARPEFFADPELLREGVAKALEPFVSPETEPRSPL